MLHFPVLLEESVDFLVQKVDGNYIDCTYGRGGHSSAILDKINKNGHLTSFDKDPRSL
jgi:16S rRNA (cytosine1402-N4)-methyltransferase